MFLGNQILFFILKSFLKLEFNRMKILFINTNDSDGGAARAQYRIFNGLNEYGIDVEMYVLSKKTDMPNIFSLSKYSKLKRIIANRLINMSLSFFYKKKTIFSLNLTPSRDLLKKINNNNADIVHLHWINSELLSIKDIAKINKPIIWTLHDMWAFTGGCHYSSGCMNYTEHCRNCPLLESSKKNDISYHIFTQKLKTYYKINYIITPSEWLAKEARKSKIFNETPIKVIGNGIDELLFAQKNQSKARKNLGIKSTKKVLLYGAMGAKSDFRKGYDLLIEALKTLNSDCDVAIFGTEDNNSYLDASGRKVFELGKINSEKKMVDVYSSADVMVVPSREDNLPNTVLEAMMCHLPVVGFDIGGLPDMVKHKKTGYLARPFDVEDLAYGVNWVLNHNIDKSLSKNSRHRAVKNYNIKKITADYLTLYIKTMSNKKSNLRIV